MLSVFEQYQLKKFSDAVTAKVVDAIRNKKIKRKSRRPWIGTFEATVNASGKLAESVEGVDTDTGLNIMIAGYVDKLIFGQPPGESVDVNGIAAWITVKDLSFSAKRIAAQIRIFGSSIWQYHKGENSGLFEDVNFEAELDILNEALFNHYAGLVLAELDLAA